ncbi:GGDEF domain-containing protein [Mycolicibacterium sp. P1-18]|nr:GGDEF domain-containing protein [Mycolicibacterium sp. P1-18]
MVVVPTDPGGEVPAVVMASALLTAYATCFHGGRLLLVTWMVIAAAIVDAALRGGAADPHFALGSALVIGGVNLVVAVASEMARRSVLHLDERDGVHRVSGLLTDVEFRVEVAKVLATRDAGANRHLVVAVLDIDGYSVVTGMTGPLGGLRARVAVGTALRDHVGRNVLVAHRSDSEFLVADVVSTSGVTSLMGNVRNAMAHSASRLTVSAGVVSTPLSPLRRCSAVDVLDEIVALATAAMADARRAGGNTVRCRVNPRLAAVGGSNCNPR